MDRDRLGASVRQPGPGQQGGDSFLYICSRECSSLSHSLTHSLSHTYMYIYAAACAAAAGRNGSRARPERAP
jgi:hypothetical protein